MSLDFDDKQIFQMYDSKIKNKKNKIRALLYETSFLVIFI